MPVLGLSGGAFDNPSTKGLAAKLVGLVTATAILYVVSNIVYITSPEVQELRDGNLDILDLSEEQEEQFEDVDFDVIIIGGFIINLLCFACIIVRLTSILLFLSFL